MALLDTAETAHYLRLSTSTLAGYRHNGGGPRFVKVGTKVLYHQADLDAWITEKGTRRSTADTAPPVDDAVADR